VVEDACAVDGLLGSFLLMHVDENGREKQLGFVKGPDPLTEDCYSSCKYVGWIA